MANDFELLGFPGIGLRSWVKDLEFSVFKFT